MSIKNLFYFLLLLSIVGVAGFFYFKNKNSQIEPPFKVEHPVKRHLVQYVNASGTLDAKDQITVGSLVAGRVISVLADDNDVVKKDQVLAILDDGVGKSAINKFKGALHEAKANLEYQQNFFCRQTELFKANQISKDLFQKYKRDLEVAKAQVEQVTGDLQIRVKDYENLFIKAPDDGVIIAREVDLGQMITARFQAMVLYIIAKDLKEMEARVEVDEADVGMVEEGQDVIFTVDAFPRLKFCATVKQIRYLAKIKNNVVTYDTILEVKNPALKLRPGMTTNVDIKVKESINALSVHNRALRINSIFLEEVAKKIGFEFERVPGTNAKTEMDSIWILSEENKFKQIKVCLGTKQGSFTEILSNEISEADQIIVEVEGVKEDNVLLNQLFQRPGSFGSKS